MMLNNDQKQIIKHITDNLQEVKGVTAIVLGGSHATGHASAASDLDIGIYYHEQAPFDIQKIKTIAKEIAIDLAPTVTDFYEWGPWVNGGAWIHTSAGKVDFLYRNIEQVANTVQRAQQGEWENHYEQQPPYGFSSVFYLAECKDCISLYDPHNIIGSLKDVVKEYPSKLRHTIIQHSLWSAEFTLIQAETFASQKDMYNTAGCLTRALKNIVSALFAICELYPIGDKRAMDILAQTDKKWNGLSQVVEDILSMHKSSLSHNTLALRHLFEKTVDSAGGIYQPLFPIKKME
jgi:predicted nucleotidyltransferase